MYQLLVGKIPAIEIHVCKPKAKLLSATRYRFCWRIKIREM